MPDRTGLPVCGGVNVRATRDVPTRLPDPSWRWKWTVLSLAPVLSQTGIRGSQDTAPIAAEMGGGGKKGMVKGDRP